MMCLITLVYYCCHIDLCETVCVKGSSFKCLKTLFGHKEAHCFFFLKQMNTVEAVITLVFDRWGHLCIPI